jgi:hypothetical protein
MRSSDKFRSADRWAVLVAGMHRSGTSVIANAIHVLGADLPRRLMPASDSNPAGHFEPEVIVSINDKVLAEASRSWADWRKLPENWLELAKRYVPELLNAVHDDFPKSRLLVLKDPRLCRLLPLWNIILDELGYHSYVVLPYRQPTEVARSLYQRNGLNLFQGYMLWLRYLLDAELATRGRNRLFVRYEDLLEDPGAVIRRIASGAPITWPKVDRADVEVKHVTQSELRHQRAAHDDIARVDLPAWTREVFNSYNELHNSPNDQDIWKKLDEIRASFDDASDAYFLALERVRLNPKIRNLDRSWRARKLQEIVLELEGLRAELASGPSYLQLPEQSASLDGVSSEKLIEEKSARLAYLYAVLGQKMAVISEMRDLIYDQARFIDGARAKIP